jgi:hypothetical protein
VLASWVVSGLAFVPLLLILRGSLMPVLGSLPQAAAELPQGELLLITIETLRPLLVPIGLALASGLAVLWLWTVLWHAGVVGWQLWSGGRRVRLGEVLGLGMVAWWKYARLSATALAALVVALAVLWVPLLQGVEGSRGELAGTRIMWLLWTGVAATKLIAVIVWLATLRGAWLLGLIDRRSALAAWFRGLWDTMRTPFASIGTLLLWLLPAMLLSMLPLAAGLFLPSLRDTAAVPAAGLVLGLARSFCWIGLFASFAPVTGLVGPGRRVEGDAESGIAGS